MPREPKKSHLFKPFIDLMEDIGRYGEEKYKEESFAAKARSGDFTRGSNPRVQSREILKHSTVHGKEYLMGVPHDHFKTRGHQLAAAAFNNMMEYYYFVKECERR